jgi:Ceramidase
VVHAGRLYCERIDPSFWAEPVNALSNAAFLIGAAFAYRNWRRASSDDIAALLLIGVTALVGLGSFAFHTLATRGAALLDILPIAVFIHGYLFVALRRFIGLGCLASLAIVVAFFAFREGLATVLPRGLLNGSVGYLPALAAMLVIGWIVRATRAGKTVLAAAAVFAVSLTFRTIDLAVCTSLPFGTHAAWHTLNAVVLYLLVRAAIDAGPVSVRE